MAQCRKKIQKGDPLGTSGFVGFLEKVKKWKRGPFGLSLPWPDLASGAQVVSGLFLKSGPISVRIVVWRKNMTGSSQVGAISKAQKYSKNNYWKHLEKFFSKKKFWIFFSKKSIFLESRTMPKNSKRGHSGSLNVFTNRKLQKNARGYPLIES